PMVDLFRKQYLTAKEQNDQTRMDEILAACPEAKPAEPVAAPEPSTGQILQEAVAELNRLQKHQDKLAKQLKRATEYRNDVLQRISTNVSELADAKKHFHEAKADVGGDAAEAQPAKKQDDAEEEFPTLDDEELAMLDSKQKEEYEAIQKEFQKARQYIDGKKTAVINAKKALDAAKTIKTKVELANQFDLSDDAQVQAYPAKLAQIKSRTKVMVATRQGSQGTGIKLQTEGKNQQTNSDDAKPIVTIFVANVTQYNTAAKLFIEGKSKQYDIIALSEHHLRGPAAEVEASRLMQYGWRSHDAQGHSMFAKDIQDITMAKWQLKGQQIAVITAYLTASIGFTGENIRKMKHLLQLTKSLGNIPWIICGDFSNTPQEFEATPWLRLLGGSTVVPQHVSYTCSSGTGRLIDYAIIPPDFRPILKQIRGEHEVPWSPRIGIAIELWAQPSTILIRKPMLPAKRPIPMTEIQREKGIKRQQRDRTQYNEMAMYFEDDLLDSKLLDMYYTQTVAMRCDQNIWDECRDEEASCRIRGAPLWVQNSLAYKQDPRMSELLGKLHGKWANAAERALSTTTEAPIHSRARRGQPTRYMEAPYPQHIAGTPKGNTKADEQQHTSIPWTALHQRCRDGVLLLQRHPIESKHHLDAISLIIKTVVTQIDKPEKTKVAETDYLDEQAALLAKRVSPLGHDTDPDAHTENITEWQ
ncbi:unnamed protein product, partial [Prorocentrum cordatum]